MVTSPYNQTHNVATSTYLPKESMESIHNWLYPVSLCGMKLLTHVLVTCMCYADKSSGFLGSFSWWRHQMETFSALLAICAGNAPVTGEFPAQRPETRNFNVFFDLRLNKRLNKQWWSWWFETPSCPLWRHYNVVVNDLTSVRSVLLWEDILWSTAK